MPPFAEHVFRVSCGGAGVRGGRFLSALLATHLQCDFKKKECSTLEMGACGGDDMTYTH